MKRFKAILLFLLVLFCSPLFAQQVGDTVYQSGLDKHDDQWVTDNCRMRYVTQDGKNVVLVKKGKMKIPLATKAFAGTKVAIKLRVKSAGITEKPKPWNGIKVMLHTPVPWDDIYQQVDFSATPFDWKEEGFTAYVPPEADTVWLYIGLENVKGKVWFDDITVTVVSPARTFPKNPDTGMVYTGHVEKRLRGMMIATNAADSDLRLLAAWGVNHIRWQLTWGGFPFSKADTASEQIYREWLNSTLQHIDNLLPLCRQLGLKIVIDLHTLPGGRFEGVATMRMFHSKEWQRIFVDVWKEIAQRYKNEPAIWGYDLANEPDEGAVPDGLMNWQQLATVAAKAIRDIDTVHTIIIEGAPRGGPEALAIMEPIPVKGVVYSFHMYVPAIFTHQGIDFEDSLRYPGIIQNREWNIATVRKTFEQVRKWQQDYNTHIYVGEFSAIRWATAESAYYYLRDCIDLFEEYGWDWAYHAFREWQGWSVEHSNDKANEQPSAVATERQKLLMKYFRLNKQ